MSAPTPQGVSALLKRAGFTRSVRQQGRIRGLKEHSEGFKVTNDGDGRVEVHYLTSSWRRSVSDEEIRRTLDKYAEVLRAAGWHVQERTTGVFPGLVVAEASDA